MRCTNLTLMITLVTVIMIMMMMMTLIVLTVSWHTGAVCSVWLQGSLSESVRVEAELQRPWCGEVGPVHWQEWSLWNTLLDILSLSLSVSVCLSVSVYVCLLVCLVQLWRHHYQLILSCTPGSALIWALSVLWLELTQSRLEHSLQLPLHNTKIG